MHNAQCIIRNNALCEWGFAAQQIVQLGAIFLCGCGLRLNNSCNLVQFCFVNGVLPLNNSCNLGQFVLLTWYCIRLHWLLPFGRELKVVERVVWVDGVGMIFAETKMLLCFAILGLPAVWLAYLWVNRSLKMLRLWQQNADFSVLFRLIKTTITLNIIWRLTKR